MQQLLSVPPTFLEVPWSDSTDRSSEVCHSLFGPDKLVQQGVAVGVDNGTPKVEKQTPNDSWGMGMGVALLDM